MSPGEQFRALSRTSAEARLRRHLVRRGIGEVVVPSAAMRTRRDDPASCRGRRGSAVSDAGVAVALRLLALAPSMPALAALFTALAPLLLAAPARAEYPDWESLADVTVIEVVTRDADGDLRETKVWFVLVDGASYLRTGSSRWFENLRRDPNLVLRIEGREYEARAEEIPGDDIVEAVDRATLEKYGWQERMIHPFRLRKPNILRLSPREGGAEAPP